MPLKLVVFDMDQTLVNSTACICNAANAGLKAIGKPTMAPEKIRPKIGMQTWRFLQLFSGEKDIHKSEQLITAYKAYFKEHCIKECTLYDGVKETLATLQKKKINLAVATTAKLELAVRLLKGLGIVDYFDLMVGEEVIHHEKPDPESLFMIADHFKIDPDDAFMVGDTVMDVEAGKSAGMHTVAVTYGIDSRKELEAAEPDHLINSMRELLLLIEAHERR